MNKFASSRSSAVVTVAIGIALLLGLPKVVDEFALIQITIYIVMSILALSLAFIWGYGGILCFGQAAFFGLGSYTYAIAVNNMGDSTIPFLLSMVVPAAFSALLGYVMFYGKLSDVYMGVITLTVTLILFNVLNSTSGPEWKIGVAPLGGFNGIPSIPPLNMPGNVEDVLGPLGLFNLSFGLLLAIYIGLRILIASKVGHVIVAIKENEQRALLLGYDARAFKLFTFTLGGAIAGLSGCLFTNWGAFTSPAVFSLGQSAAIIIWVIVGGLGTLVGPVIGSFAIQWLTILIGAQQALNANLVLGVIMMVFVLLVPKGIVPSLGIVVDRLIARTRRSKGAKGEQPPAAPAVGTEAKS